MSTFLIKNATLVNEGEIKITDVLIVDGIIEKINPSISSKDNYEIIEAEGLYLLPGVIDDQVHFREPGLTHKGDIHSESRAAVAGGITTFMEMPNTAPPAVTHELLEQKYAIAAERSMANYSFYLGADNTNIQEVLKTDPKTVCGIKVFMGSSTGNMLVDDQKTLESIFSQSPMLVAVHCEDEETVRKNLAEYKDLFGDNIPPAYHPVIRSREACFKSSSLAVTLAKRYGTRLHVLHISTEEELQLFDSTIPLKDKKITAEACIHHLWFNSSDYDTKGNLIKWNPAVKSIHDQNAVFNAVLNDAIDVIATDHAPHTLDEKQQPYTKAPSGGPLVQHALVAMLEFYKQGKISLEKIIEKMCHAPAVLFNVNMRGFVREGYWADLVLVDLNNPHIVTKESIQYKCGWSPFEGTTFSSRVTHTFVNGKLAYIHGSFDETVKGQRLVFDR